MQEKRDISLLNGFMYYSSELIILSSSRQHKKNSYRVAFYLRPYIVVEDDATGTTDIINLELAYLGYEAGYGEGRTGLRYEAGDGSIIRGNEINNLYFGLYTFWFACIFT